MLNQSQGLLQVDSGAGKGQTTAATRLPVRADLVTWMGADRYLGDAGMPAREGIES